MKKIDPVSAAREILPLITSLRRETEADRRIARPIVDRLVDARLCRMMVPRALEGLEVPIPESLAVYEDLASAEASVAWVVWNNGLPCLFGRFLDPAARAEVFGDPAWLYASSTRPTGRAAVEPGGYRVTGRWALVSGCELAEWIVLLCLVEEDGQPRMTEAGPEMRLLFVRRADCEILDTWHAGGLRGTGSHDVVVTRSLVPHRLAVVPGGPVTLDGPMGRVPIITPMATGYAAQAIGIARTCLESVVQLVKTKFSPDPGPQPKERPALLASIALEAAALDAARGHVRDCASRLWDTVRSGPPTIDVITAVWAAALHAAGAAEKAVDAMYAAGGSSSLYTDCPVERAHRDMHALRRHVIGQVSWAEDAGRVRLGLPPVNPLYAL
jgi:alkylation response protein AidB-like acyl-CoA dehydrogenase